MQKEAIRNLTGVSYRASTCNIFRRKKILSFSQLYYYRIYAYIKKHFTEADFERTASARVNRYVNTIAYRTTRGQNSFKYRSIQLLNLLNKNIYEFSLLELKQHCLTMPDSVFQHVI